MLFLTSYLRHQFREIKINYLPDNFIFLADCLQLFMDFNLDSRWKAFSEFTTYYAWAEATST